MSLSAEIRNRLDAGASVREIVTELGCKPNTVRRVRWNAKHPDKAAESGRRAALVRHYRHYQPMTAPRDWTPDEDRAMINALGRGATYTQVAEMLGRSKMSIAGRLHKLRKAGKA